MVQPRTKEEVIRAVAAAARHRIPVTLFESYMAAVKFGIRFAEEDGLMNKLVSVQEWPTPGLRSQMRAIIPLGSHRLLHRRLVIPGGIR